MWKNAALTLPIERCSWPPVCCCSAPGCIRRSLRSAWWWVQLFGFVGLFVAVPILSLMVIAVEEFWVKPVEESDARRRGPDIVISRELGDGDDGADQHEDDDEHLNDDPKAGKLHRPSATR